jgi:tRNA (guanine-N7-)-methyltransferase
MAKILHDYPSISLKSEDLNGKIDFAQIFGRKNPIHIEIGSGKAAFLLNQAKAQPDVNFLGIEWARKFYRYSVDRIGRWGLKNVRIIRTDAVHFLINFVPDNFVDCFHIYFPDPWPKKRHHKRRLLTPVNLEHLLRCLVPAGTIRIVTDHAEYFEQIRKVFAAFSDRLEEIKFFPTAGANLGEWVGSNFERKYLQENRPIFTIAVRKK